MKKLYNSKSAARLAAYSAMAGAYMITATQADATIVYTDITDVTIDLPGSATLDIDGDGVVDFVFANASNTAGTWTFAQVVGNWSAYGYGNPSNMIVGYSGAILPYGSALNSGDMIDAGASFMANSNTSGIVYNIVFLESIYASITYGPFANTTDKYMGVVFDISGSNHYGWVRLDASLSPVSITIKDMAYEDVADQGIAAGAQTTGVNALTANQVNAYSYGSSINVVINDASVETVNVFDIDGKVVYTNSVNSNNMNIDLSNAATGLYTVQLVSGGNSVYTKKLYIQN